MIFVQIKDTIQGYAKAQYHGNIHVDEMSPVSQVMYN